MFDAFLSKFAADPWRKESGKAPSGGSDPQLQEFFNALGGKSFAKGLYRIVAADDLPAWNERVEAAFPDFRGHITTFSFDWLGRTFALDNTRLVDGRPGVLLFEPGTGEALVVPRNLASFHENELTEYGEAALAIKAHDKWLSSGGAVPRYDQCVGYRQPLFLGGADNFQNLEISDIDVYWHLTGQMIVKVKGLPVGTRVRVHSE